MSKLLFIILTFISLSNFLFAQVSKINEAMLVKAAKQKVVDYEDILNVLINTNIPNSKKKEIIANQFDEDNLRRIFFDKNSKVFDYINVSDDSEEKIVDAQKFINDIQLKREFHQLQNFDIYNMKVDKIDVSFKLPYILVSYNEEVVSSNQKKVRKRIASLKAVLVSNEVFLYITSIANSEEGSIANDSQLAIPQLSAMTSGIEQGKNLPVKIVNSENLFQGSFFLVSNDTIALGTKALNRQNILNLYVPSNISSGMYRLYLEGETSERRFFRTEPLSIEILPKEMPMILAPEYKEIVKRGSKYTIKLNMTTDYPIRLELRNGRQFTREIWQGKGKSEIVWEVPKNLKVGSDYKFILTETNNNNSRIITSPNFRIKRKIPLAAKVTPLLGIISFAAYKFITDLGSEGDNGLPSPVFPE